MNRSFFEEGPKPTLEQVLVDREKRVLYQGRLLKRYPDKTLIVLKVNVPGEVKNNLFINHLLNVGRRLFKDHLTENILFETEIGTIASLNWFCVVDTSEAQFIKKLTIKVEEEPLGRLFDFDVYINDETIGRKDLGVKPRTCYLCSKDAKECGRQRTHSVEALLDAMIEIYTKGR